MKNGEQLKEIGMQQATDSANKANYKWSEIAYSFLQSWIKGRGYFMAEDARFNSKGFVPVPPSKRAWGLIMVKAAKNKLIRKVDAHSVSNKDAHCALANVWQVC